MAAPDGSKTEPRTVPELLPDCAFTEAAKDNKPTTQTARVFFIGFSIRRMAETSYSIFASGMRSVESGLKMVVSGQAGSANATNVGCYEYCAPGAC